jgi:hypothetical protein
MQNVVRMWYVKVHTSNEMLFLKENLDNNSLNTASDKFITNIGILQMKLILKHNKFLLSRSLILLVESEPWIKAAPAPIPLTWCYVGRFLKQFQAEKSEK